MRRQEHPKVPNQRRLTLTSSLAERALRTTTPSPHDRPLPPIHTNAECPDPSQVYPGFNSLIRVKWIVEGSPLWWRANVLSIHEQPVDKLNCPSDFRPVKFGKIAYEEMGTFPEQQSTVVFGFCPSSRSLLLATPRDNITVGSNALCSWLYDNDPQFQRSLNHASETSTGSDTVPFDILFNDQRQHDSTIPIIRKSARLINKEVNMQFARKAKSPTIPRNLVQCSHTCAKNITTAGTAKRPSSGHTHTQSPMSTTSPREYETSPRLKRLSNRSTREERRQSGENVVAYNRHAWEDTTQGSNPRHALANEIVTAPSNNDTEIASDVNSGSFKVIDVRLHLLERSIFQLQSVPSASKSTVQSSIVLLTLKWALLKKLEKPLRGFPLTELNTHGIAKNVVHVKSECDYSTFKDIAALLARRHGLPGPQPSTSRIKFLPDFNIIQSGSLGVDNLYVAFSCLADVAHLLGIQDDDDYEAMLIKESKTTSSHFLQIIGCMDIQKAEPLPGRVHSSHSIASNLSVGDSSNTTDEFIRVFVGCVPHDTPNISELENVTAGQLHSGMNGVITSEHHLQRSAPGTIVNSQIDTFRTAILGQKCRHFSTPRGAYRSPWTIRTQRHSFKLDLHSHEVTGHDEPLPFPDTAKCFFLHWSRSKPPSTAKWSRDAYSSGLSAPGHITLSIPTVFSASRHNISSITNLLDDHVETFMTLRWRLHNNSVQ